MTPFETLAHFFLGFAIALAAWAVSPKAFAVLTIEICGSRDYECSTPTAQVKQDHGYLGKNLGVVQVTDGSDKADIPLNPTTPYPTPPGWSAPPSGSIEPVPPATAGKPTVTYTVGSQTASSVEAAFNAHASATNLSVGLSCPGIGTVSRPLTYARHSGTSVYAQYTNCSGVVVEQPGAYTATVSNTCPAGYTNSGGTCNLTNPAIVQKPADGRCPVGRVGNTYTTDLNDPDCASGETPKGRLNVAVSGGTVTAGTGTTERVNVTVGADGTVTVTSSKPDVGSTVITTVKGSAPASGTGNVSGQGQAQAVSAGAGSLNTPETGTQNCGTPGQPRCNVSVDESGVPAASSVTQAGTFGAGKTELDTAFSGVTSALNTFNPSSDRLTFADSWFPTFSGSSDCAEPVPLTIVGVSIPLNLCGVYAPFKAVLAWLLWVGVAVFAWFRVTRGATGAA